MPQRKLLVTGGSQGLGRVLVEEGVSRGHLVGYTYCKTPVEQLFQHEAAFPFSLDSRDVARVEMGVEELCDQMGGIDVLVNNAGVLNPSSITRRSASSTEEEVTVNLTSAIVYTKQAFRSLRRSDNGCVVNVSSIAASSPMIGQAVYSAAKAGIEGFTKAVSFEASRLGITVVALRLDPFDTRLLRQLSADILSELIPDGGDRLPLVSAVCQDVFSVMDTLTPAQNGCVLDRQGNRLLS